MRRTQNVFENASRLLLFLCWGFLLFVGVYDLFVIPYRSLVWFGSFVLSIILYFRFTYIKPQVHLLLAFAMILNVFGELFFEWYYVSQCTGEMCASPLYDKFLHFANPFIIATFVYHAMAPHIREKRVLVYFAIFATLSLATMWEVIEFGFDKFFGALMQGVYTVGEEGHLFAAGLIQDRGTDTSLDLLMAVGAMILFRIVDLFWVRRKDLVLKKS